MFEEGRYDEDQLRRNRLAVALGVVAGVAACLLGGALTSWPWANALGSAGLVVVFGSAFWWLFASRKAGPLQVNEGSMQRLRRTFWMR